MAVVDLLGLIYHDDMSTAPYWVCFAQGLIFQFTSYVQAASAFGFAMQTYRLLVLCKQESGWETRRADIILLIFYPLILIVVLTTVCLKYKAIGPQATHCDVVDPPWIRLIGYSGSNLVISTIGMYISGRSAYALITHLALFRSTMESKSTVTSGSQESTNRLPAEIYTQNENNADDETEMSTKEIELSKIASPDTSVSIKIETGGVQLSTPSSRVTQRRYSVTKGAAIRMVSVSVLFILINFLASIETISAVLRGKSFKDRHLRISHLVGPLIGISLFLVFGTGREMRKNFTQTFRSIRNGLRRSSNPGISRFE
ncbi:11228_t:CDS:2 [Ambispora gerdemannii]|uniref:11228_t:CDS:1 n=1 Tax=Ambispora gerdemannii TaxID=144530 RepID=A0A9N9AMV4_9GLOM|nr:11228_t:CDS:2 [Ambispora gerdemannii]